MTAGNVRSPVLMLHCVPESVGMVVVAGVLLDHGDVVGRPGPQRLVLLARPRLDRNGAGQL